MLLTVHKVAGILDAIVIDYSPSTQGRIDHGSPFLMESPLPLAAHLIQARANDNATVDSTNPDSELTSNARQPLDDFNRLRGEGHSLLEIDLMRSTGVIHGDNPAKDGASFGHDGSDGDGAMTTIDTTSIPRPTALGNRKADAEKMYKKLFVEDGEDGAGSDYTPSEESEDMYSDDSDLTTEMGSEESDEEYESDGEYESDEEYESEDDSECGIVFPFYDPSLLVNSTLFMTATPPHSPVACADVKGDGYPLDGSRNAKRTGRPSSSFPNRRSRVSVRIPVYYQGSLRESDESDKEINPPAPLTVDIEHDAMDDAEELYVPTPVLTKFRATRACKRFRHPAAFAEDGW